MSFSEGHARWREGRLTGSDWGKVTGNSEYGSAWVLWRKLIGDPLPPKPYTDDDLDMFDLGHSIEEAALRSFQRRNRDWLVFDGKTGNLPFSPTGEYYQHPEHEYIGCSPDGVVQSPDGVWYGLECKAPSAGIAMQYRHGVPAKYKDQCAGIGPCSGLEPWGGTFFINHQPIDGLPRFNIQLWGWKDAKPHWDNVLNHLVWFWEQYVVPRREPPFGGSSEDLKAAIDNYPRSKDEELRGNPAVDVLCETYHQAKEHVKAGTSVKNGASANLRQLMKGARRAVGEKWIASLSTNNRMTVARRKLESKS
jgi:predicted phage-related endonuclease